jgi:hypothetical protein
VAALADSTPARLGVPTDAQFESLYGAAGKIGVADCWTHCSSYCCKTNHPDQQFALMKCGSAGLVYPLEEFKFLQRRHMLQAGATETARHRQFVFDPARDLRLSFVVTICELGGRCSEPAYRPTICKFYPFYPSPEAIAGDVALANFVTGSVIDQHWSDLSQPHPCWIVREQSDVVLPQTRPALAVIQQHPYFTFYIGAAAIFVRHVSEACRARNLPAPNKDLRQFFREWEVTYLSGRLVDVPRLQAELTRFHDALVEQWGPFEL